MAPQRTLHTNVLLTSSISASSRLGRKELGERLLHNLFSGNPSKGFEREVSLSTLCERSFLWGPWLELETKASYVNILFSEHVPVS